MMKKIAIADVTLRLNSLTDYIPGFKEKIEITKLLDRLRVDVIETAPIKNGKSDILFLHAILPLINQAVVSCPITLTENPETAYRAISAARHARLNILAPVSTVQMEYMCHKKPPMVLESIKNTVETCKKIGVETEVSFLDATRAEYEFLLSACHAAIEAGADIINFCDCAGQMLPGEMYEFITKLLNDVPELVKHTISVECSDALHLAAACAIACIKAGATQIKAAVNLKETLSTQNFAELLQAKSRILHWESNLDMTMCEQLTSRIAKIITGKSFTPAAKENSTANSDCRFTEADTLSSIGEAVKKLGYELSADDLTKVYDEFCRIVKKAKELEPRDLDAIVAAVAMQVPPTYQLKTFVINSGNIITSMAHVVLQKGDQEVQGFSMGDGPIDAAFLSIENILGRHFELDDFQISAVTQGREAVGSGIVRLRSQGKLYSGKGISTDIIGAGIRAYVDAINKICYEENEK